MANDYGNHANEVRHDIGRFYLRATTMHGTLPLRATVAWFRTKEDAEAAATAASSKYPSVQFSAHPGDGAQYIHSHRSAR